MSTRRAQIVVREVGYQLEKGGGGKKMYKQLLVTFVRHKDGQELYSDKEAKCYNYFKII